MSDSGDLSQMAATGTTIPGDAGKQNLIPSVPRPDQIDESNSVGGENLAGAADNASDMPRRNKDIGATGEVLTATGDQLPAQVESKRLHFGANDPLSKGHDRFDKHSRQKESDLERYAGEGAGVDEVPGEEELSEDKARDNKAMFSAKKHRRLPYWEDIAGQFNTDEFGEGGSFACGGDDSSVTSSEEVNQGTTKPKSKPVNKRRSANKPKSTPFSTKPESILGTAAAKSTSQPIKPKRTPVLSKAKSIQRASTTKKIKLAAKPTIKPTLEAKNNQSALETIPTHHSSPAKSTQLRAIDNQVQQATPHQLPSPAPDCYQVTVDTSHSDQALHASTVVDQLESALKILTGISKADDCPDELQDLVKLGLAELHRYREVCINSARSELRQQLQEVQNLAQDILIEFDRIIEQTRSRANTPAPIAPTLPARLSSNLNTTNTAGTTATTAAQTASQHASLIYTNRVCVEGQAAATLTPQQKLFIFESFETDDLPTQTTMPKRKRSLFVPKKHIKAEDPNKSSSSAMASSPSPAGVVKKHKITASIATKSKPKNTKPLTPSRISARKHEEEKRKLREQVAIALMKPKRGKNKLTDMKIERLQRDYNSLLSRNTDSDDADSSDRTVEHWPNTRLRKRPTPDQGGVDTKEVSRPRKQAAKRHVPARRVQVLIDDAIDEDDYVNYT